MGRNLNIEGLIKDGELTFDMRTETLTLAGNLVLGADSASIQFIDPAGARNINLPPEADAAGKIFIIINMANAAEIITVLDDAGAGLTPAITPTQNETAFLFCDGTTWRGTVALGA